MKRLSIFSFYDSDGIVDDYVLYILKELQSVSYDLYFVANGLLTSDGKRKVEEYTRNIIIRSNTGFDAGAYADVLINFIGSGQVKSYDELILCNNTFFGPFLPMKEIFNMMNQDNVDYWGLNYIPNYFVPHLQSYFLVFRKNILSSGILIEFFKKHVDMNEMDITNVLVNFETGICQFLASHKYRPASFGIPSNCDIYLSGNYSIKKYNVPILKKKIDFSNKIYLDNYIDALRYIRDNTIYDVSLILRYLERKYRIHLNIDVNRKLFCKGFRTPCKVKSIDEIKNITQKYNKIYLYGAGQFARRIYKIFCNNQIYVDGFVISDDHVITSSEIYNHPVYHVSNINDSNDILFVIAMNTINMAESKDSIKKLEHVLWIVK